MFIIYNGLSSCVKDNKSDSVWYLGLKFSAYNTCYYFYVFYVFDVFLKIQKTWLFTFFLLCFTRFFELCCECKENRGVHFDATAWGYLVHTGDRIDLTRSILLKSTKSTKVEHVQLGTTTAVGTMCDLWTWRESRDIQVLHYCCLLHFIFHCKV